MATVNKASLRSEFDALTARFESLCAEGKMSAESRALVDALLMLFKVLMAVFMEKHTPKSSANSSLPASQSPHDATARTRPGAKGRGPSTNAESCANTRTREHVRVLGVDACERCGEDLTSTACTGHERRTLIDIVFEKVVRHADAEIKHCPRCRTETRPRFPAEMPGPLQYGPGVKAYVVHLLVAQMLSLKRVAHSTRCCARNGARDSNGGDCAGERRAWPKAGSARSGGYYGRGASRSRTTSMPRCPASPSNPAGRWSTPRSPARARRTSWPVSARADADRC